MEICSDEYVAEAAPFFACSPISTDTNSGLNAVDLWQTPLCLLVEAESNPFVRSRTQPETQNTGHLIEVTRYLKGSEQGTQADAIIDRIPGPIYILDMGQRIQTVTSQVKLQQAFLPKALLGWAPDDRTVETAIEPTHPKGVLLHQCMDEIYGALRNQSGGVSEALFERFVALLKVNMGIHPQREDVRRSLRQTIFEQICAYIEENLSVPDLTTGVLLQRFGVSRASLYRMFESHGGVRTYIMQRRVARAVLELEQDSASSGRIRRAAERWGFSSQPNFNRKIRSQYGTNPGNLFTVSRQRGVPSEIAGRTLNSFAARTAVAA
nr:helix-turn-helix domain-containing protein [Hyphomonas sp. Mor2]